MERLLDEEPPQAAGQARALYFDTLRPQFARVKRRVQDVLDLNHQAILRADTRTKEEARAAAASIGVTAAVLLGAALAWRNVSAITPLVLLTRQAEEVGSGSRRP